MFGLKWNGVSMSQLMTYQRLDKVACKMVWKVGYLATDVHTGGY